MATIFSQNPTSFVLFLETLECLIDRLVVLYCHSDHFAFDLSVCETNYYCYECVEEACDSAVASGLNFSISFFVFSFSNSTMMA